MIIIEYLCYRQAKLDCVHSPGSSMPPWVTTRNACSGLNGVQECGRGHRTVASIHLPVKGVTYRPVQLCSTMRRSNARSIRQEPTVHMCCQQRWQELQGAVQSAVAHSLVSSGVWDTAAVHDVIAQGVCPAHAHAYTAHALHGMACSWYTSKYTYCIEAERREKGAACCSSEVHRAPQSRAVSGVHARAPGHQRPHDT